MQHLTKVTHLMMNKAYDQAIHSRLKTQVGKILEFTLSRFVQKDSMNNRSVLIPAIITITRDQDTWVDDGKSELPPLLLGINYGKCRLPVNS